MKVSKAFIHEYPSNHSRYPLLFQKQLKGVEPPPSRFGSKVDALQVKAKEYLDGKEVNGIVVRSRASSIGRFLFMTLIITNVAAVLFESVPEIVREITNEQLFHVRTITHSELVIC